ncbi:carbohydrate porin, partial [Escherichia coli]|nr:carbohydrate porin [Escherichia coli]
TQQAAEIREIKAAQGNTPVNGQTTAESAKKNATSPNLLLSGYGDLKIYGDVEFNMDAESNHGLLAMTNADVNSDPTNEQWNLNGRILLGFDGMRKL